MQRLPPEQWSNLQTIEPVLLEYQHLLKAGAFDDAFAVVEAIDNFYLSGWGYAQRVFAMREALLNKNLASKNTILNLIGIGRASITLGKSEAARQYLLEALQQSQNAHLTFEEGIILANLAQACFDLGEYERSIEFYRSAIQIAQQEPRDLRGEAARLCGLAVVYRELGELRVSLSTLQQGVDAINQLAPVGRSMLGTLRKNQGDVYRLLGQYDSAETAYKEALAISREKIRWNRRGQHEALSGLAAIAEDVGELEQAAQHTRDALNIAIEISEQDSEGYKKRDLGRILWYSGQITTGLKELVEALNVATSLHIPRLTHYTACDLAQIHLAGGQVEDGYRMIEQAASFIVPRNAASFYTLRGMVFVRLNSIQQALDSFDKAVLSAEHLLMHSGDYQEAQFALALAGAGKMLLQQTDSEEARRNNFENVIQNYPKPGVLKRVKILFDILLTLDSSGFLSSAGHLLGFSPDKGT